MGDKGLSLVSYLKQLQIEYVITELRRRIYPYQQDKNFYSKLIIWKKIKIDDISLRNRLPNIFDNETVKKEIYLEVYGSGGYPKFYYSDKLPESIFGTLDKKNYYFEGEDVSVVINNETIVCKSLGYDGKKNKVKVKIDKVIKYFDIELITRIL